MVAWALLPLVLLRAFWQSLKVIRRVKPDVVVSMGGYIAFPGGMMGVLCGKPLVVHEPGAHAGLTNRALALIADRVLVGFPKSFEQKPKNALARLLPTPKQVDWLGTPVRADIASLPEPGARFAGRGGAIRLLVVGGSLGAQALNEVVPKALGLMADGERPVVTHQSGEKHLDALRRNYSDANVKGELVAFIDDMAQRYAEADLVICRAGAMTIAELSAGGMASVLVPFPHAVDDHQRANARFLADKGAALLVPQSGLTAEGLATLLRSLDRHALLAMAQKARALGKPDATRIVADRCVALAKAGAA
jgi:UDP-N-acetylglucosamine--N-acetylmuramyl-(pentapeptide) pyrophosphoryl-undecaprenol N-acetylglucosamine transferase